MLDGRHAFITYSLLASGFEEGIWTTYPRKPSDMNNEELTWLITEATREKVTYTAVNPLKHQKSFGYAPPVKTKMKYLQPFPAFLAQTE